MSERVSILRNHLGWFEIITPNWPRGVASYHSTWGTKESAIRQAKKMFGPDVKISYETEKRGSDPTDRERRALRTKILNKLKKESNPPPLYGIEPRNSYEKNGGKPRRSAGSKYLNKNLNAAEKRAVDALASALETWRDDAATRDRSYRTQNLRKPIVETPERARIVPYWALSERWMVDSWLKDGRNFAAGVIYYSPSSLHSSLRRPEDDWLLSGFSDNLTWVAEWFLERTDVVQTRVAALAIEERLERTSRSNPPPLYGIEPDEAVRKIGDAFVFIELDEDHPDVRMSKRAIYKGKIVTEDEIWFFDELGAPAHWNKAWDSDEAFDEMAGSAVSFGSYYTTHNRGDDTPDWAPDAEVADAIEEATAWAMDDEGNYTVERVTHYEDNPPTFTAKGERMYESIKAGYLRKGMRPADAKRIAAATVYARAGGGTPGLVKSRYSR